MRLSVNPSPLFVTFQIYPARPAPDDDPHIQQSHFTGLARCTWEAVVLLRVVLVGYIRQKAKPRAKSMPVEVRPLRQLRLGEKRAVPARHAADPALECGKPAQDSPVLPVTTNPPSRFHTFTLSHFPLPPAPARAQLSQGTRAEPVWAAGAALVACEWTSLASREGGRFAVIAAVVWGPRHGS